RVAFCNVVVASFTTVALVNAMQPDFGSAIPLTGKVVCAPAVKSKATKPSNKLSLLISGL
ncbi:MAG: hypothetical protein MUE71_06905, partial [Chitinophagaceae bacterium]|nr:hypothetical protein [Chitinophagaceae bacterium]